MSGWIRRIGNVLVAALLRSRLHRTLSGSLILISYRGRKSGREFTVPVAYAEDGEGLTVFVGHSEAKSWWRSMPGANVRVRLRGVDFDADASVVKGSSLASAYLARQPRSAGAIAAAATNLVFVRLERRRPLPHGGLTRTAHARPRVTVVEMPVEKQR